VAHEMLVSAVRDRLRDFFADGWTAKGWKTSAAYRDKVLTLDPKNKGDPWRASLVWLRQMDAIDDDDERAIRELTLERNRLAHELRKVVGSSYHHLDFEGLFPKLLALVAKIDRWWVVNVDIETDPELMDEEIDAASVVPGSQILLQVLAEVALGKDEKAWALYREFMANPASAQPS